jgi:DNA-binding MarR family transcriptional regulator
MDFNVLARGLEVFGFMHDDMQLSTLRTLIYVVNNGGSVPQSSIENYLKKSRASVSRNIDYWTDEKFDGRDGIGFLKRLPDPKDRRANIVELTPVGKEFIARMRNSRI